MAKKKNIFPEFSMRYGLKGQIPAPRLPKENEWWRRMPREFWR